MEKKDTNIKKDIVKKKAKKINAKNTLNTNDFNKKFNETENQINNVKNKSIEKSQQKNDGIKKASTKVRQINNVKKKSSEKERQMIVDNKKTGNNVEKANSDTKKTGKNVTKSSSVNKNTGKNVKKESNTNKKINGTENKLNVFGEISNDNDAKKIVNDNDAEKRVKDNDNKTNDSDGKFMSQNGEFIVQEKMLKSDTNNVVLKPNFEKRSSEKKARCKKVWVITCIVLLFIFVFTTLAALLASGIFTEKQYLKAWNKDYYKTFEDKRMQLVAHAILAPNGHNLQSWSIEYDKENENDFQVFVNPKRVSTNSDGKYFEAVISIGCFIEYLDISSKILGYEVEYEYFPKGEYDEQNLETSISILPVVKVKVSDYKGKDYTKIQKKYYDNMFVTTTQRGKYENKTILNQDYEKLAQAIEFENVNITKMTKDADLTDIKKLYSKAVGIVSEKPYLINEQIQGLRTNEGEKNKFKYGSTLSSQNIKGIFQVFGQGILTMFPGLVNEKTARMQMNNMKNTVVKSIDSIILLTSANDDRITQIDVGRAYAKMTLVATNEKIAVQPLSYLIQNNDYLQEVREEFVAKYVPQGQKPLMVMRVGYVNSIKNAKSMRMLVEEITKPS